MDKQLKFEVGAAMRPLNSIKEASGFLKISPWSVRGFIRDGKLTAVRLGRRVLIRQEELERFVAEHTQAREMPNAE